MQISVQDNLKQFSKQLAGFRDQIPFAASVALNNTAFDARLNTQKQLDRDIDRPTPFTRSGVRFKKSNKRNLTASVLIDSKRWAYLSFQVNAGTRTPRRRVIVIPVQAKLNKYGNAPRNQFKTLAARSDTFIGNVRGTAGLWQRISPGRLKLLYRFTDSAKYSRLFNYDQAVQQTVSSLFNKHFKTAITKAIKTARL